MMSVDLGRVEWDEGEHTFDGILLAFVAKPFSPQDQIPWVTYGIVKVNRSRTSEIVDFAEVPRESLRFKGWTK
jgi:hypothetical protein